MIPSYIELVPAKGCENQIQTNDPNVMNNNGSVCALSGENAAVPGDGDGLRGLISAAAAPPPPAPWRCGALGGSGRWGQPVAQRHRGRLRGGGLLSLLVRTASAGALRLQQRATQWARAPPFLFSFCPSTNTL
jgi:hypothetical protein